MFDERVGVRKANRLHFGEENRRTLVAAHRGASRVTRDNSLGAVDLAVRMGADLVEIDVRRTADGVLVANHDPHVDGRPVQDTKWADLADHRGYVPAPIEDIVRCTSGRASLDIELKEDGYEHEVLALLDRHVERGSYVVTSFLEQALVNVKKPDVITGLLSDDWTTTDELFGAVRRCGADIVLPEARGAGHDLLDGARERSIPVVLWTVNDHGDLERFMRDSRVAGIITDVPDAALALREDVSQTQISEGSR